MGLTPLALVMMAALTLPLAASALAAGLSAVHKSPLEQEPQRTEPAEWWLNAMWLALSALWFGLPLAQYETSDFFQHSVWHRLLGVSLAASFPLSWHLAFVAIPSAGARFLAPLLGLSRTALLSLHKTAAMAVYLIWGG